MIDTEQTEHGQDRATLPISVIIPVYNRAELVPRAIASVRAQRGFQPAEVIVVDDASEDDSAVVAEELGARVIRLAENGGAGRARATGMLAAQHPWLAPLDSDDEWLPMHLATLWPFTEAADLVTGATLVVAPAEAESVGYSGTLAHASQLLDGPGSLYPDNFVASSGVLVRAAAVARAGGPATSLRFAEDLDLWLRILERGTGWATPQPVVRYHRHAGQKSTGDASRSTQRQLIESYRERPWWRPQLVHFNEAFRSWDAARAAIRNRDVLLALKELGRVAMHPARMRGLARLLIRRLRLRRRQWRFDRNGDRTVALVGDVTSAGLPPSVVVDYRALPARHWLLALARAPTSSVRGSSPLHRIAAAALRTDFERGGPPSP